MRRSWQWEREWRTANRAALRKNRYDIAIASLRGLLLRSVEERVVALMTVLVVIIVMFPLITIPVSPAVRSAVGRDDTACRAKGDERRKRGEKSANELHGFSPFGRFVTP